MTEQEYKYGCSRDITLFISACALIMSVISTCTTCQLSKKDRELEYRPYLMASTYADDAKKQIMNHQIGFSSTNQPANIVHQKISVKFEETEIDLIETDETFIISTDAKINNLVELKNFQNCMSSIVRSNCVGAVRDIYIEYTSIYSDKRYFFKSKSTWTGLGWNLDMNKAGIPN